MEQRTLDGTGVLIMSTSIDKNTPCKKASHTMSQNTKKIETIVETLGGNAPFVC